MAAWIDFQAHTPDPEYAGRVIAMVCQSTGLSRYALLGPRKTNERAFARFAVMWALRSRGYTLRAIARCLDGFDHSTVSNGVRRAGELIVEKPEFAKLCAQLLSA